MISSLYTEIEELIFDYCNNGCSMKDYCAKYGCPITIENYQDYIFPDDDN